MKRRLVLLTCAAIMLTFAACGEQKAEEPEKEQEQTGALTESPEQTDSATAYSPCVMVDGIVYKDTGYVNSMVTCGTMDGEITSSVDGTELPTEDDQSNFGTGYAWQRSAEGYLTVVVDGQCMIFRDIESEDTAIPEFVCHFTAEVKEDRGDGTLLVSWISTAEGFQPLAEGDYVVSADNLTGDVRTGDMVTIWFDGGIEETEPARIGNVYRIEAAQP
ncbi:MAG: hypothetical protein Q4C82_08340 [Eubacteriales bacterium]|nr:hypothetical protein [Eubacteriales bacterium]